MTASSREEGPDEVEHLSTTQLLARVTEQTSGLVRDEVALAKAEIQESIAKVGTGAGLFGSAGVITLYGVGALLAAAILGLATAIDAWFAALLVGVVLLGIAGVVALTGKRKVSEATPPLEASKQSVKRDVDTLKRSRP